MKDAGINDPIVIELFGQKSETGIALQQYGAFSGGFDKYEGLRTGAACGRGQLSFYSEAREFCAVKCGGVIVAEFANVARAQTPGLAGGHGGGDLSAEEYVCGRNYNFGAAGGEMRNRELGVRGIQANADYVYLGNILHSAENTLFVILLVKPRGTPQLACAKEKQEKEDHRQREDRLPAKGKLWNACDGREAD